MFSLLPSLTCVGHLSLCLPPPSVPPSRPSPLILSPSPCDLLPLQVLDPSWGFLSLVRRSVTVASGSHDFKIPRGRETVSHVAFIQRGRLFRLCHKCVPVTEFSLQDTWEQCLKKREGNERERREGEIELLCQHPPMRECFMKLPPIGWRWLGLYNPARTHHWMRVTQGTRSNLWRGPTLRTLLTALPAAGALVLQQAGHPSVCPSLLCPEFQALNQSVCPEHGVLNWPVLSYGWGWGEIELCIANPI